MERARDVECRTLAVGSLSSQGISSWRSRGDGSLPRARVAHHDRLVEDAETRASAERRAPRPRRRIPPAEDPPPADPEPAPEVTPADDPSPRERTRTRRRTPATRTPRRPLTPTRTRPRAVRTCLRTTVSIRLAGYLIGHKGAHVKCVRDQTRCGVHVQDALRSAPSARDALSVVVTPPTLATPTTEPEREPRPAAETPSFAVGGASTESQLPSTAPPATVGARPPDAEYAARLLVPASQMSPPRPRRRRRRPDRDRRGGRTTRGRSPLVSCALPNDRAVRISGPDDCVYAALGRLADALDYRVNPANPADDPLLIIKNPDVVADYHKDRALAKAKIRRGGYGDHEIRRGGGDHSAVTAVPGGADASTISDETLGVASPPVSSGTATRRRDRGREHGLRRALRRATIKRGVQTVSTPSRRRYHRARGPAAADSQKVRSVGDGSRRRAEGRGSDGGDCPAKEPNAMRAGRNRAKGSRGKPEIRRRTALRITEPRRARGRSAAANVQRPIEATNELRSRRRSGATGSRTRTIRRSRALRRGSRWVGCRRALLADRGGDRDRERGGYPPTPAATMATGAVVFSQSGRPATIPRDTTEVDITSPRAEYEYGGGLGAKHPRPRDGTPARTGTIVGGVRRARAAVRSGMAAPAAPKHRPVPSAPSPPQQQQQTYGAPAYQHHQQHSVRGPVPPAAALAAVVRLAAASPPPTGGATPPSSTGGRAFAEDATGVAGSPPTRRETFRFPADDASELAFLLTRRWMPHRSCALLRALLVVAPPPSRRRRFGRFCRRAGLFEIVPPGRATRDGQPPTRGVSVRIPVPARRESADPRLSRGRAFPRLPRRHRRAFILPDVWIFLARRNSRDRDPRPRPPTGPSSSWSAAEASPADASRRGVTPPPSWDALPARGPPARGDRPRPSPNPPSRIAAPREASTRRRAYAPPKPRTRPARARETVTTAVSVWAVSRTTRLARSRSRARPSRRASARPDRGNRERRRRTTPTRRPDRASYRYPANTRTFSSVRPIPRLRVLGPKIPGTGFVRGASRGVEGTPHGAVPRPRDRVPRAGFFLLAAAAERRLRRAKIRRDRVRPRRVARRRAHPRRTRAPCARRKTRAHSFLEDDVESSSGQCSPGPGLSAPRLAASNAPPGRFATRPARDIDRRGVSPSAAASNAASNSPGPGVDAARRAASKTPPGASRAARLSAMFTEVFFLDPASSRWYSPAPGTPRRRRASRNEPRRSRRVPPRRSGGTPRRSPPAPARATFSISTVFVFRPRRAPAARALDVFS